MHDIEEIARIKAEVRGVVQGGYPGPIVCRFCGVHIPLQQAVGIIHSDRRCPACQQALTPEDVNRYTGMVPPVPTSATSLYQRLRETGSDVGIAAAHILAETDHELAALRLKVDAYDYISQRADEAHAYCQAHLLPWGENVWHAILADAHALRLRLQEAEQQLKGYQEREAACCPEDVGFEEYIGALETRLAAALRPPAAPQ